MENKIKLLLVDDEEIIRENLSALLERSGFAVATATDGRDALDQLVHFSPDLVILDVMMPALNGRDTLRQMRHSGNWTPVILLTQVGDAVERAMALEEGADDYLNKPFDTHELIARVRTVLRRVQSNHRPSSSTKFVCNDLILNRSTRRVYLEGQELLLTPKAVTLLEYLMMHPDELISRENLLNAVWGWDYPVGVRAVDTRVAELRKLLHDDASYPTYIETVPGQGYRFILEVANGI